MLVGHVSDLPSILDAGHLGRSETGPTNSANGAVSGDPAFGCGLPLYGVGLWRAPFRLQADFFTASYGRGSEVAALVQLGLMSRAREQADLFPKTFTHPFVDWNPLPSNHMI